MEGAQLQNIKGIGDKLSQKIIDELGGEDELNQVIENLDLERLINIDGISQRKAIEIMNQLIGNPAQKFLKSDRAIQLYEEIIEKMKQYNIESKRIQFIYPKKNRESDLFLIEGIKNGNSGIKMLTPLIVHNDDNTYTDEVLDMLNF